MRFNVFVGCFVGGMAAARAQAPAPVATVSATSSSEAGGAQRTLTLEQALAMAKRANKSLVAERARVAEAQVNLDQAWTVLFPTVAAQGKYTRNNAQFSFPLNGGAPITLQPYNQLDGSISASTLLFAPAVYPGLKAVNSGLVTAQENMKSSEDSVLFTVAQTFYAAAIADEVLAARDSNIAVAKATWEIARTRFGAGAVTKVDVDRAELAVLRAEQAKRESESGRSQSYRALATLIETNEPFRVVPPTKALDAGETEGIGQDLGLVLKLRPEFRALDATTRQIDEQRKADAWKWAPSISGFGNARIFNYKNFALENHSWAVGASLDWVLYDGGNRDADRHLQIARLQETMARAEVLSESIRDDIANGKVQLRTKHQAQMTAERSVGLAQETVELTRAQYEAGSATQIDVLQAQDALVAAQDDLARAHFDVALSDLTLRRAAGTFPER
ncbi:MAG TPA: TolC family protein [Polyangia bacterium]